MITVTRKDSDNFNVEFEDSGSKGSFNVTLDNDYHKKLTDTLSKEELIEKSFEFLLEREPVDSILSSFNLKIISRYFPEYESEMQKLA